MQGHYSVTSNTKLELSSNPNDFFQITNINDQEVYKDFYVASQGGIARLAPDTPIDVPGIGTYWLQTCLGIVLVGKEGHISVIHKTPNCDLDQIIEEIKWACKNNADGLKTIVIAYNPRCYENEEKIKKFVAKLDKNLLLSGWKDLSDVKYVPSVSGTIAFDRSKQKICFPGFPKYGKGQFLGLRVTISALNDLFRFVSQKAQLSLQYNGQTFCDIPDLFDAVKKVIILHEEELKEKTEENNRKLRNYLYKKMLTEDNTDGICMFTLTKEKDSEHINRQLTIMVDFLFDYVRYKREMEEEYRRYYANQSDQFLHFIRQSLSEVKKKSQNQYQGFVVTASGDAHAALKNEIQSIIEANQKDFQTFSDAIENNLYSKALRTACTSMSPDALELIIILFKYQDKLDIQVNEQAGTEKRAAIHYAALKGNREVYDYLRQHGADVDLQDKSGVSAAEYFERAIKSRTYSL